jgi:hypothetical protein
LVTKFVFLTDEDLKGVTMSVTVDPATAKPDAGSGAPSATMSPSTAPPAVAAEPTVKVRRRTIDAVLIGAGIVVTFVLVVAGTLLAWGSNFATDYVDRELSAQNINFPDEAALVEEGRADLAGFGGQQVNTGNEAEAYASYIDGHLAETADGATYSELGGPERAARAAVQAAKDSGASADEVAALQADLDTISGQRNTLFKGETLRGLLLSTYAWSTVGRIAGIAAIVSFVAAGLMLVLVILGFYHHRKTPKVSAG